MPAVSVILPFYNAEKTLNRAIQSIADQTFDDFECILIDNNSTDSSIGIAQAWLERDRRFKIIHEKEQGVMFASNYGATVAGGKYIARMDADDWSFPDRLKLQARFLDENPTYGAVSGMVEYIKHKKNTEGFARYVDWINSVRSCDEIELKQFIEAPIVNPTAMWRKVVGDTYGLYKKGDFPEDYEMWLRWLHKGVKICKLNDPILKWFDSDSRLTRTNEIYSDAAFFKIKTQYLAKWLETNNPYHPKVAVWGASKISRKRTRFLIDNGIQVHYYIDIKKSRQLATQILYYEDIPLDKSLFILVYMKHIQLRNKIEEFLKTIGYTEGKNYLFVS